MRLASCRGSAVVGDEHERAAPSLQRFLEVADRVDVEMVLSARRDKRSDPARRRREEHAPLRSGRGVSIVASSLERPVVPV